MGIIKGKCKQIIFLFAIIMFGISFPGQAQIKDSALVNKKKPTGNKHVLYGIASFYSDYFNGRQTSSGEIFSQKKMTCACNVLPLNTWIRVTNLRNGKSIIVKTNDHIAPHMKRIVDLTRAGAVKLNFVAAGLTRVKVEVLGKKAPKE